MFILYKYVDGHTALLVAYFVCILTYVALGVEIHPPPGRDHMFQTEFAERLIAKVGEKQYGRLAVNTQLFVKVSCVCKVARGSFNPPPQVYWGSQIAAPWNMVGQEGG